jgi:hexosaminidase
MKWLQHTLVLLLLICMAAVVHAQGATRQAAGLSLHWEIERNLLPPEAPNERSNARFTLVNRSPQALPAQGWSLYFTCLSEAVTGPADGPFTIERVVGTLYRARPTADFKGLAAGQSLSFSLVHPDLVFLRDRAPLGPYLVFDDEPDRGLPITDYRIVPPTRPAQLARVPSAPSPLVSAEEHFLRSAVNRDVPADQLPPVFPTPQQWSRGGGTLQWSALPAITASTALKAEAAKARAWLRPFFASDAKGPQRSRLHLSLRAGMASPEAYELTVDPQRGVHIVGGSPAGVQHGLQALRDLLPIQPNPAGGVQLPELQIQDAPRFAYRGVMLDVARSFHPKATVIALIDLMARLKLNTLHFHLTDDEGWRLAIPALPELTAVGARRGHTADPLRHLPAMHGSGAEATQPPGSGFYSAQDYIEILRHAAARHVEVIPEIEMPGHARAAVVAMRARAQRLAAAGDPRAHDWLLNDPADRSVYRSPQAYDDHLMDPGLEGPYRFIDTVVAELVRLHRQAGTPLRTLHVGADETPVGAWTKSPAAQATIDRLKLAGTAGLWNHFYDRVGAILKRHGLKAAGWEELGARRARPDGSGPLVPNEHFQGRGHTLFVWNNLDEADDLAYRLANAGYRTVLAPATALYFDMAHTRDPSEPGVNWAAITDLQQVFDYVPLDALRSGPITPAPRAGKVALSDAGRRHIAGLQATLFSEVLHERAKLEYMAMPRLLGLAERAWAPDPAWAREADPARAKELHAQAWSVFVHQAGQQLLPRLTREMPGLNWRIAPPGLQREDSRVRVNHQLPGLVLRATTDLSEPTASSPAVTGPIETRATVRAAAFAPDGRRGAVSTLASPDRIVFMGDSITEGWGASGGDFFADPARINRGISGQTTPQMLARFETDVIAQKPRAVMILAGTNDIAGNSGPTTEPEIAARIAQMAARAKAAGIRVILVSVLPADRYWWAPAMKPAQRIVELNRILAVLAKEQGHDWVDLHTRMADANQGLKLAYGEDGVHPNEAGYRAMRGPVEAAIAAALR